MSLKILHKPADELLALRIRDLLQTEGVEAMLRSYQMPWYDGLARMMRPEWGEVLVNEEDFDRAQVILDDLLLSLTEDSAEGEPGGESNSGRGEENDA